MRKPLTIFMVLATILIGADSVYGSPLQDAVRSGDREALSQLLHDGADVNQAGSDGYTPLMVAAARADLESVELLLKFGANPGSKTGAGATALLAAVSAFTDGEKVCKVVRVLLDAGANPNPSTQPSPLAMAMIRDHSAAAALLEQRGAVKPTSDVKRGLKANQLLARGMKSLLAALVEDKDMSLRVFLDQADKTWETYSVAATAAGASVAEAQRQEFLATCRLIYHKESKRKEEFNK